MRHDMVVKMLFKKDIRMDHPEIKPTKEINEPEYIQNLSDYEYWCNLSINMAQMVPPHNKPDLVIWNANDEMCNIVEFCGPAETKITKMGEEKLSIYIPLVQNLQIMYPDYHYQITPIIVGYLGQLQNR